MSIQIFTKVSRLSIINPLGLLHQHQSNRFASMSAAETDSQAANVANSSGITPSSLQSTLTEKLEAQYVSVEDISGESTRPKHGNLELLEDI